MDFNPTNLAFSPGFFSTDDAKTCVSNLDVGAIVLLECRKVSTESRVSLDELLNKLILRDITNIGREHGITGSCCSSKEGTVLIRSCQAEA